MLVRLKYWFNNTVFLLCSIFMLCLPIIIPLAAVIFVGFIFAEVKGDTIALLLLLSYRYRNSVYVTILIHKY